MTAVRTPTPRRVVITGLGAVTPLGLTAKETWEAAIQGRSGVSRITLFEPGDCPVTIAAEVKNFDISRPVGPFRPRPNAPAVGTEASSSAGPSSVAVPVTQAANSKDARRMGRFTQLALAAGLEAYGDSGLDGMRTQVVPERMGVNIGVGMGGLPEIADVHSELLAKGYRRITPFFIPQVIPNMPSGLLSILLDLRGSNLCNVTACASSAHSIGESFRQIQRGEMDVMFAGGAEAVISPLGIGGFAAMRALSSRNDAPEKASRPFDEGRDGFVMGEGAAILVLEELTHATQRGARIYGELLGYGLSGDAFHMTLPAPDGEGGRRAMEMALADAGVTPEKIGYINAHGTSTPSGDVEEARAIARVFPQASSRVSSRGSGQVAGYLHVSSTKSMTGHLLGAAGALEALLSLLAIRDGVIPPTINLDSLDPACRELGIDFTANRCVEKRLDYALSNSFGFGGTNASLLLRRLL